MTISHIPANPMDPYWLEYPPEYIGTVDGIDMYLSETDTWFLITPTQPQGWDISRRGSYDLGFSAPAISKSRGITEDFKTYARTIIALRS